MKISYISVFHDNTGYSHAAQNNVLGLDAVGIDVVCRSVSLNNANIPPKERILKLEEKNLSGVTHVIQHYLPHMFIWKSGVKNIGIFHTETSSIRPIGWQYHCNLMDAIIVSCEENLKTLKNSGVTKPVFFAPIPLDEKFYQSTPDYFDFGPYNNHYKFYAIGDWSARKNYESLIKEYFLRYTKNDKVVLILKTYVGGQTAEKSREIILAEINKIKMNMRMHTVNVYPPIILITDQVTENQMLALHQQCDCFITVEKGAACCLPMVDAFAVGNSVIAPNKGGQTNYFNTNSNRIKLLSTELENCYGMGNAYPGLYTSKETWYNPKIELPEKIESTKEKDPSRFDYINNFGTKNVGKVWENILRNI